MDVHRAASAALLSPRRTGPAARTAACTPPPISAGAAFAGWPLGLAGVYVLTALLVLLTRALKGASVWQATPAVVVDGLTKAYGAHLAVDGLSFAVERGEVFGLLGPNGAGKTTTVETLEGYRKPDAGTVRVLGLDPIGDRRRAHPPHRGDAPGGRPVPRDPPAGGAAPVRRLLRATPRTPTRCSTSSACGRWPARSSAACRAARSSGCPWPWRWSAGPRCVFLDEPTAGMDPHARLTTWEVITGLKERGATVILTTHAMDEAERLCDRVAIIDGGRLVALGTPGDLTRSAGGGETLFTAAPGLDTPALAGALLPGAGGGGREQAGGVRRPRRPEPGAGGRPHRLAAGPRRRPRRPAGRPPQPGGGLPPGDVGASSPAEEPRGVPTASGGRRRWARGE